MVGIHKVVDGDREVMCREAEEEVDDMIPNTSQAKGIFKKNLQDYQYYLGSAKQASDYEATTSYLINQIKKTYAYGNDIATALDRLQHVDLSPFKPTLQSSQSKDEDIKALEN